jgi:iron complex transport system substrate-binding protein
MSFLNEVINGVADAVFKEELQERVEIILHKIKFMDKVPVICLDTANNPTERLNLLLETAGGLMQEDPINAKVLIYEEQGRGMLEMMGIVPALLEKEWPAVTYNRVYLFDDHNLATAEPEVLVSALEDLAEMLYPGYFVFGNEGRRWTSFSV